MQLREGHYTRTARNPRAEAEADALPNATEPIQI